MKITIGGKNIDIGDSLREYININIAKLSESHLASAAVSANVSVEKDKKKDIYSVSFVVDVNDHSKVIIKGSDHDPDPYHAFDKAMSKAITQLKKHKNRIASHRKFYNHDQMAVGIKKYVVDSEYFGFDEEDKGSVDDGVLDFSDEDRVQDDQGGGGPTIVAEEEASMLRLTLREAVMRMDLSDAPVFVFINKLNSHISILYYRKDGNISWIDTQTVIDDDKQSET